MIRRFLLFTLLVPLWCAPAGAVEPEIDPGLQQSLEGDAGLDVDSAAQEATTGPGQEYFTDDSFEIDEEVLQEQKGFAGEDFVPAPLTVVRRKQHDTACEYWVKLDNLLPFKIRNMALRFTTYLRNDNYNRPVVFDSEVVSFSELRPTDYQFRNIFYAHVDCEDLRYIKVEDASRCSMGELTKFSAQTGDCIKYIEVVPSDLICIYLDDGSYDSGVGEPMAGGRSKRNPCGLITQYDIDRLLTRMIQSYNEGNHEEFAALFSPQVESNGGRGLEVLETTFPDLFNPEEGSTLRLGNVSWKPGSGGFASIWLRFRMNLARGDGGSEEKILGVGMRAAMRQGGLAVSHFFLEEQ